MSHANHPEADDALAHGLFGSEDDRGLRLVPSRSSSGGPLVGLAGRDRYYATRLRQLARIDLDEGQAGELWADVVRHRADLSRRLGRDVGAQVALLDHLLNVRPRMVDPQIVEKGTLETMEHRAIVDPLTGLFNREYFETQLARETERYRRYGAQSSLLLIDLDRFKQVNDCQGHRRGDDVLCEVGNIVRDCLRAADIPCRYGGDELAVILTDADESETLVVAERIRAGVARAFRDDYVPVTVSIGLTLLKNPEGEDEDAFVRADRALYKAKDAGGNLVIQDGSQRPLPGATSGRPAR
ncbi:MAG TPA: GGDEF domain-containing protein [Gemmatimonadaceae bacterium]|nr:GGDEF domain-containing protein [Gemmatimonadaceae bacterium]